LGLEPAAAAVELARIKNLFFLLPDAPAICAVWESLVLGIGLRANRRATLIW
jgi:hypothetical protein